MHEHEFARAVPLIGRSDPWAIAGRHVHGSYIEAIIDDIRG